MAEPTPGRPVLLHGLTDDQVDLYYRMIERVAATGVDYWTTLRGLDAPAADKYALADTLHATAEARYYAGQAGIDTTRTFTTDEGELTTRQTPMADLRVGDRFVVERAYREGRGMGTAVYEVTGDRASNPHGWLPTRDLGREHTWDDRTQAWADERFFSDPPATLVHRVIEPAAPAPPTPQVQTAAPRAFPSLDMSTGPIEVTPPPVPPASVRQPRRSR